MAKIDRNAQAASEKFSKQAIDLIDKKTGYSGTTEFSPDKNTRVTAVDVIKKPILFQEPDDTDRYHQITVRTPNDRYNWKTRDTATRDMILKQYAEQAIRDNGKENLPESIQHAIVEMIRDNVYQIMSDKFVDEGITLVPRPVSSEDPRITAVIDPKTGTKKITSNTGRVSTTIDPDTGMKTVEPGTNSDLKLKMSPKLSGSAQ